MFLEDIGGRIGPARNASGYGLDPEIIDTLKEERMGFRGMKLRAVLRKQLRESRPGALHNTMVSVVSVMASRGSSDETIRAFVDRHFAAPTIGPYAAVWNQVDEAIATAIKKFGKKRATIHH
jgi:predicted component of type VI protein secretion system